MAIIYNLSTIFDPDECKTIYNVGSSNGKSRFENKRLIYDSSIYGKISSIANDISKYLNYYLNNGGKQTDELYIQVLDLETKYLNDYKTYFSDKYVWTNNNNDEIMYLKRAEDLNVLLNSNYFEYYLMVQQIERYNCCYLTTFRQLTDYYTNIFNTQNYFCRLDKLTKALVDQLESERGHFLDNTDGLSGLAYYTKILNNINNRKSYISTDFTDYANKLKSVITVQESLNLKIDQFLSDIKLTLKIISLVNILFNMHQDDNDRGKNYSSSIGNVFNLDTNSYMDYYTSKSLEITSKCPPNIINMKSYLKSDMSNYKDLINLAASACFNTYGFSDHCSSLSQLFTTMGWNNGLSKKFTFL